MTKALKLNPIQPEVEDYSPKLEVVQDRENSYDSQLENEFKLKSEFFEKNVDVDHSFLQDQKEDYTQVKIYREGGIDIIDPRALKEFIATHKGINQVVIEKISLNEATRVSLLFEPLENGEEMSTLLEDQIRPHFVEQSSTEELSTDKSFSLDELETLVNQDFFGRPVVESIEEESDILPKSKLNFDFPAEETSEKLFTPRLVEDCDTGREAQGDKEDKETTSSGLNLKLKDAGATRESKQLNYEKHTLTRKKNKSGNAFYYRAKDHMELYKVGSSYLKDFNSGLKSFSFASCGLDLQREKSVLGITSFFNYHEDINICVVTRDVANSFYSAIAENLSVKAREIFDEDLTYDVHHAGGFDLVELSELKKVERKLRNYDFEHFLDHLLDSYDLILWDLPALEVLDSNKELYFPIIRSLDNVSFIVGKNKSKVSEINSMVSYFKRYQIQIKGLLFSEESPKGGAK
jgi:hypothetical protein